MTIKVAQTYITRIVDEAFDVKKIMAFYTASICVNNYMLTRFTENDVSTTILPGRPRGLEQQRSKPNYLRMKSNSCKNSIRTIRYKPHTHIHTHTTQLIN